MGVVLVFEPASDAHWMKDVVQFPNAFSQLIHKTNATLITRPNHKQNELRKHIKVEYFGNVINENFSNFEYSDFTLSKLVTDKKWYLQACSKASQLGGTLILYPWYGDAFKGAQLFKIRCWLRLKRSVVILKTDGLLREKAERRASLKEIVKDYLKFIFIDKIICENYNDYSLLRNNQKHLSSKIIFIPNCPLDMYQTNCLVPYMNRAKIFLFVGRIGDKEKGVDILIENWLKVFDKIEGWILQLVGPCTEEFKNGWILKIFEAGAERTIQWYSSATPEVLLQHYSNARVVICSSRKESGPIVLSEAVLSGCAFIGSAVGEIPHLLKGLPGLVNNTDKLGDEILLFASNDTVGREQAIELKKRMGDRKWSEQVKKLL